jgi:hypothetical protein
MRKLSPAKGFPLQGDESEWDVLVVVVDSL